MIREFLVAKFSQFLQGTDWDMVLEAMGAMEAMAVMVRISISV
jgi:hypothetical protein